MKKEVKAILDKSNEAVAKEIAKLHDKELNEALATIKDLSFKNNSLFLELDDCKNKLASVKKQLTEIIHEID